MCTRLRQRTKMITNLQFRNFKIVEEREPGFAPLTGFFGPNSSGKSSLIQFLLMLKTDKRLAGPILSF